MNNQPDVSIIIVSWNSEKWLPRCLASIFEHTSDLSFEVIVVDNASKDQTVQLAMNSFTGVRVIPNNQNLGFAKAVNQGLEVASGKYVCLLNPDTEVFDRTIERLVAFLEKYPTVGMVGPHLMNTDQSTQRSIRRRPMLADQLRIILKWHVLFPDSKAMRRYLWRDFNYEATQEVEQIMGACMMIRSEVIDQVGIFDENFFLWFEEVDYCRRVFDRTNFKIYYDAHTHLIHARADSFDKLRDTAKQKIYLKSLRYYFKKHHERWAWFVVSLATPFSIMLSWFGGGVKKTKKGKKMSKKNTETFKNG